MNLALSGKSILKDIDFTVRTGELTAIVGEVGAGKTQLLHSLVLATPTSFKEYSVFEKSLSPGDHQLAGSFFSLAPQDAFTLSESVSKNVHFNFEESDEEQDQAARSLSLAAYDSDLATFRDGIDTELGEYGINLSGGQRQRLGLARAHFYDRPVILLDDSLSAVDTDTENFIIDKLLFGDWIHKTRILVTHRLNILPRCDQIIFMVDGRIKARGTWTELQEDRVFKTFVSTLSQRDDN